MSGVAKTNAFKWNFAEGVKGCAVGDEKGKIFELNLILEWTEVFEGLY